eukprot:6075727-Prymnesium_polylepis.1
MRVSAFGRRAHCLLRQRWSGVQNFGSLVQHLKHTPLTLRHHPYADFRVCVKAYSIRDLRLSIKSPVTRHTASPDKRLSVLRRHDLMSRASRSPGRRS